MYKIAARPFSVPSVLSPLSSSCSKVEALLLLISVLSVACHDSRRRQSVNWIAETRVKLWLPIYMRYDVGRCNRGNSLGRFKKGDSSCKSDALVRSICLMLVWSFEILFGFWSISCTTEYMKFAYCNNILTHHYNKLINYIRWINNGQTVARRNRTPPIKSSLRAIETIRIIRSQIKK